MFKGNPVGHHLNIMKYIRGAGGRPAKHDLLKTIMSTVFSVHHSDDEI